MLKLHLKESLLAIGFAAALLTTGCGALQPKSPLTSDLYQYAYLSEPIKMRKGFTLVSREFEITSKEQIYEVNVGFARNDDVIPYDDFFCLTRSRKDFLRDVANRHCANNEPGVHVKWSLLTKNSGEISGFTYDSIIEDTNGKSAKAYALLGLGAISNQPPGLYRVKVEVLRDFSELDIVDPSLVIDKPFFRKNK